MSPIGRKPMAVLPNLQVKYQKIFLCMETCFAIISSRFTFSFQQNIRVLFLIQFLKSMLNLQLMV